MPSRGRQLHEGEAQSKCGDEIAEVRIEPDIFNAFDTKVSKDVQSAASLMKAFAKDRQLMPRSKCPGLPEVWSNGSTDSDFFRSNVSSGATEWLRKQLHSCMPHLGNS